jgi:hypothetical protein
MARARYRSKKPTRGKTIYRKMGMGSGRDRARTKASKRQRG